MNNTLTCMKNHHTEISKVYSAGIVHGYTKEQLVGIDCASVSQPRVEKKLKDLIDAATETSSSQFMTSS